MSQGDVMSEGAIMRVTSPLPPCALSLQTAARCLAAGLLLLLIVMPACQAGGPSGPGSGQPGAGGGVSGSGASGSPGQARGRPPYPAPNPFAASSLWDDGKAELNAYDATYRRYGVLRPFTAYHIVVKEDFSRRQLVKADPGHDPADLVAVLKLNQVFNFQTGIYSYHQMASTFYDRTSMDLLKFTLTSNEWCGNTFKEYTRRNGEASLHVHAYWDNQAEATYVLPLGPDVVLYDQLPLWVRSLPQLVGASRALRLVPGQVESKGPRPDIIKATLRCAGEESVPTPAGTFMTLRWELSPTGGGGAAGDGVHDVYWTVRDFPYLLVAWDKADGSTYRLKWTQRLPYWQLNRPGDEKYLLGSGATTAPGAPATPGAATGIGPAAIDPPRRPAGSR